MKIDIDFKKVLQDEFGEEISEGLSERIVDGVIRHMREEISEKVRTQIDDLLALEVKAAIKQKSEQLCNDLLDYEFQPVGSYGSRGAKTTLRNQIIEGIAASTKFEKKSWSSDQSVFTNCVETAVKNELKQFTAEMQKVMTSEFKKECVSAAAEQLKSLLVGIEKR